MQHRLVDGSLQPAEEQITLVTCFDRPGLSILYSQRLIFNRVLNLLLPMIHYE